MIRFVLQMIASLLLTAVLNLRAADSAFAPGLVASFQDDAREVSEVVLLPELGLDAGESPHPAIKPAFVATYAGFLLVEQPGRYQFETQGTLSIGGEVVSGERVLAAGRHALRLTFQRPLGAVRFGLSWQSDSFVKEPVPPAALWHATGAAPAAPVAYGKDSLPSPPARIRGALVTMKCVSCHDAVFLGTMHHKFEPTSLLTLIRHAGPPKWYGAMTGPLVEESETLRQLAADLRKLPHGDRSRTGGGTNSNSAKSMVGTQKGFACIACHDFKHHKTAAETKAPDLAQIAERVSYDWFVRWMNNPGRLKPGVPMPPFFAGLDAVERQKNIDALWDYLAQGQRMELPDELLVNPKQFVLKPGSRPIYTRTYMRLPDGRELLRAICVGLPNGVSYCFDAETCRLAYVWTGGFLDMAPHWQNQSGMPTPALGTAFHLSSTAEGLQIGDQKPVFRGYEMVGGIPRFEFAFGDAVVRLLIDASSPDRVRQTFAIGKRTRPIVFVGPPQESPVSMTASLGSWAGNRLTISDSEAIELVLQLERRKQ